VPFQPEDINAALAELAGTSRKLLYDVTEEDAPHRSSPSTPFVHGSPAWWQFVARRRSLDDGQGLSLMISLRGLRTEERLLIVNWGSKYANSFLLIEPADPWLDLSTPEGIGAYAREKKVRNAAELVRSAYADWNYWIRDEKGDLESRSATLTVESRETLWQVIEERLPQTFPAAAFLSSLTLLSLREAELFTGGKPVHRAIAPFLTRLGLPVVYDPRHVIQGVRELVNAGLAWVQDPQDNWRSYRGPNAPIPAEVSDERVAYMER
jgi:hypothetical protein